MGWPTGLEPVFTKITTWSLVRFGIGHSAFGRTRTGVLLLRKQARSPLRHEGPVAGVGIEPT